MTTRRTFIKTAVGARQIVRIAVSSPRRGVDQLTLVHRTITSAVDVCDFAGDPVIELSRAFDERSQ
jgi:hypothetical protein